MTTIIGRLFFVLVVLTWIFLLVHSVRVETREEWQSWPRRGATPLATSDCMTDACLEYREAVLAEKLRGK